MKRYFFIIVGLFLSVFLVGCAGTYKISTSGVREFVGWGTVGAARLTMVNNAGIPVTIDLNGSATTIRHGGKTILEYPYAGLSNRSVRVPVIVTAGPQEEDQKIIRFSVPKDTTVTMTIYDTDTNVVATPMKGKWYFRGNYEIVVDVSKFVPGTYTYEVVAGKHMEQKSFDVKTQIIQSAVHSWYVYSGPSAGQSNQSWVVERSGNSLRFRSSH